MTKNREDIDCDFLMVSGDNDEGCRK